VASTIKIFSLVQLSECCCLLCILHVCCFTGIYICCVFIAFIVLCKFCLLSDVAVTCWRIKIYIYKCACKKSRHLHCYSSLCFRTPHICITSVLVWVCLDMEYRILRRTYLLILSCRLQLHTSSIQSSSKNLFLVGLCIFIMAFTVLQAAFMTFIHSLVNHPL